MNEFDVRRLGFILSIQAEIEGMKADNEIYKLAHVNPAYNENDFQQKADELKDYALRANHQLI